MKYKRKITSFQINNGFTGSYYLPYSIGLLSSYYNKYSQNKDYEFDQIIYKREPISKMVNQLYKSDVLLFSTYVWNINISLEIAKRIKNKNKNSVTIFGGPSVPDNAKQFLEEFSFIDIACHQEGERKITNILDNLGNGDWRHTPGISFLEKNNFVLNKDVPRIRDLSAVPSPYLSGAFEKLMEEKKNENWLASWETNRGCPFSCAYCDWGSATNSKVSKMEIERLYDELEWFARNKIEFLFVCDANFGMLPRDYDLVKKAIEVKNTFGYPHVLSVQATKNARERSYKVQKLLYDGGLHKSVNIAMQTTDSETLKNIQRDNISNKDYEVLQKRFIKDGIPTYSDLIIGLPGDNYKKFKSSVDILFDLGQNYRVQFNNLSILPNAPMADPDYIKKYDIRTINIPVVNMHGSLEDKIEDDVYENQALVYHHKDMDKNEWLKIRTLASAVEFYYYDKMLQIPLIIGCYLEKIKLSEIIELFLNNKEYRTIKVINNIIFKHANQILKGDFEFLRSKKWLNIYWPPGELAMLKLVEYKLLDQFYDESFQILKNIFSKDNHILIHNAILYNKFILNKPASYKEENSIKLEYDIKYLYRKILKNGVINKHDIKQVKSTLVKKHTKKLTQLEWARKVIWYGHRNSAYYIGDDLIKNEISGHY